MPVSTPAFWRPHLSRWGRWGAGVVALGLASAALAYLLAPYALLRDWYLARTPDLYRAATWSRTFFTPAVKAQGNWFCVGGLVLVAVALAWVLLPRWRPALLSCPVATPAVGAVPLLARADWPYLAGLLLAALALWGWAVAHLPPAYDEVFSVVYSAGSGSLVVAGSYYMLPNNHLLFNVLNGGLFGWLPLPLLLTTGRLLAGLGYGATVAVVYRTLAGLTGQRAWAAALALLAALQYSLWGFGGQARGYALYALMHWLALATLLHYWQRPSAKALWVNALAVAVGYALVPTFLFYHGAQLLAAAAVQLKRRRWASGFWQAQAVALGAVYWLYLPALCFSGLEALKDNPYVRPHHGLLSKFVLKSWPGFLDYATYCFGNTGLGDGVGYALALLPLVLLGWPAPAGRYWPWRRLAALYAAWLLVLVAGTLQLQLLVFPRNLLGLFSVMLVLGLLALGVLLDRWRRWAGVAAPLVLAVWIGARFIRNNPAHDPAGLYSSNMLGDYQLGWQRVATVPLAGTRAFSEESFYPYFLSQQAGRLAPHPARRPARATTYFVTAPNDRLPARLAAGYAPVDTVGGYRLYRWQPWLGAAGRHPGR